MIDMLAAPSVEALIQAAIEEDIGTGDHTSLATISPNATGKAKLIVKQKGIIAGVDLVKLVFRRIDPEISFEALMTDGSPVSEGDIAFIVEGKSQSLLAAERIVLNFMQRMSGIATKTNEFVKSIEGSSAKILDTRKTTPGLRLIEKWAVRIGGGLNHRIGLYDMILIKDNHIDFCGSITQAIKRVKNYLKVNQLSLKIEVETRNQDEVKEVISCGGIHRIMLDNFEIADLAKAIKMIKGQFETEASGNINIHNVRDYAATGVDFLSVGALTHSVNALDLSLKAT